MRSKLNQASLMSHLTGFLRDCRGVTMLEFALIGPLLILTLLGFMEVCYDFYIQQIMDYATAEAAREIQTGTAQSNANVTSSATFQTYIMCPLLSSLLSCNNVLVNVTGVASFAGTQPFTPPTTPGTNNAAPSQYQYCSASASQLILVRAVYFAPVWLSWFLPTTTDFNGSLSLPLISTAAFATEPFPPTNVSYAGTPPSGCT